ncbi:glycerol-3-phosphate dehydrogenase [Pararhizobium mangrovi]|uniref:glycerol-3-phosphate dehydrogenase n=1 Tax=Pararhizobium mangrovi TaxID=2590452 RepID=UPI001F2136E9|nr:glycerol-3-phosphate dehydrogenase [Pararhizobium mangrovi]
MSENDNIFDLLVIGGGVNGAGIARDASGRGLSVLLCEKGDLAEATSSRSGKLVHGGLRYLEYYEFRLVREALIEREVLMASAPHIIWPMRFVLPHSPQDRPAWLVRLGLFLYDHLGGRKKLPGTRTLDLRTAPEGAPVRDAFTRAFEYSDCWVDDARLVVLNAMDARDHGAEVCVRTECVSARREGNLWHATLKDTRTGEERRVRARGLVNAAGPWVNSVIGTVAGGNSQRHVRMVKGSHIVVPKFWQGEHAYLIQNTDRRVIFVNPYEGDKALIGTTDIAYEGKPEDVKADESEIEYLLKAIGRYFKHTVRREDVLHTFSGVRPLYDDDNENPSAVTRDYIFDVDGRDGEAPLLSVFGGKITTFRRLSEHALEKLQPFYPKMKKAWTREGHLPGGDMADGDFEQFLADCRRRYPFLPARLAKHYARLYGTRIHELLRGVASLDALGERFCETFYACEAEFVMRTEWASTAEDVVERRTKHARHMNADEMERFRAWFEQRAVEAA